MASAGKLRSCFKALSVLSWSVLGGLASFTRDFVFTSANLLSAGRIGASRTGARGQAALSGDNLVVVVCLCPVVSLRGLETSLVGSVGCFVGV